MDSLKQEHIENLKNLIKTNSFEGCDSVKEDFFEWEIADFKSKNGIDCTEFYLCGHKWEIKINKSYSKLHNSINGLGITVRNKDNDKNDVNFSCAVSVHECNSFLDTISKELTTKSKDKYCSFDKDNYKNAFKIMLKGEVIVITVYIRMFINSAKERKENFINSLNNIVEESSENYNLVGKKFYEWKIEDWNRVRYNNVEYSPEFEIGGFNWKLKLYPNGMDNGNKNYISYNLINTNAGNNKSIHIYAKCAVFIANYYYQSYHSKGFSFTSNSKNDNYSDDKFIDKNSIYNSNGSFVRPIVENNKVIIGVYISVYKYKKADAIYKELKETIDKRYTSYKVAEEKFFEWTIDNWKKVKTSKNKLTSQDVNLGDLKWNLSLYPRGNDEKDYISLYLSNQDLENDSAYHAMVDYAIYIRNYDDCSFFNEMYSDNIATFNFYHENHGQDRFMKITDLYIKNPILNVPLVNDKLVVGCFIRFYKYEKEHFLKELKEELHLDYYLQNEVITEDYIEWTINDWNKLKNKEYETSPTFVACGCKWNITAYPNGYNKNYRDFMSLFLSNLSIPKNSNIYARPVFYIRNRNNYAYCHSIKYLGMGVFNQYRNNVSFYKFVKKEKLERNNNDSHYLIEDNSTVIGAYICLYGRRGTIDNFVKTLKNIMEDDELKNPQIAEERFFEEEIEDWKNLIEDYDIFDTDTEIINGYKWVCSLCPNDDDNYVKLSLRCLDFYNDIESDKKNTKVYVKFILYIRNYKSFEYVKAKSSGGLACYSSEDRELGLRRFISKSELYNKNSHLLDDNKTVFGVYVRVYKNKPRDKIVNKNIEFQFETKTGGKGGLRYKYDENGDLGIEYYELNLDPKTNNIVYSDYKLQESNGKFHQTVNEGQLQTNKLLRDCIEEELKEDSDDSDDDTPSVNVEKIIKEVGKDKLYVATSNYKGTLDFYLDFKKNDYLVIKDYDFEKDWAKGYVYPRKNNEGLIRKEFIKKYGTPSTSSTTTTTTTTATTTTNPTPSKLGFVPPSPQPTVLQPYGHPPGPYPRPPYHQGYSVAYPPYQHLAPQPPQPYRQASVPVYPQSYSPYTPPYSPQPGYAQPPTTTQPPSQPPAQQAYPQPYGQPPQPVAQPPVQSPAQQPVQPSYSQPYGQPPVQSPAQQPVQPAYPQPYGQPPQPNPQQTTQRDIPPPYGQPSQPTTQTPAQPPVQPYGQPPAQPPAQPGYPQPYGQPAYAHPYAHYAPPYGQPAQPAQPQYGSPYTPPSYPYSPQCPPTQPIQQPPSQPTAPTTPSAPSQ